MSKLATILSKPGTGIGGVILSIGPSAIHGITTVAQCIAAVGGAIIVVANVIALVRKHKKPRKKSR